QSHPERCQRHGSPAVQDVEQASVEPAIFEFDAKETRCEKEIENEHERERSQRPLQSLPVRACDEPGCVQQLSFSVCVAAMARIMLPSEISSPRNSATLRRSRST